MIPRRPLDEVLSLEAEIQLEEIKISREAWKTRSTNGYLIHERNYYESLKKILLPLYEKLIDLINQCLNEDFPRRRQYEFETKFAQYQAKYIGLRENYLTLMYRFERFEYYNYIYKTQKINIALLWLDQNNVDGSEANPKFRFTGYHPSSHVPTGYTYDTKLHGFFKDPDKSKSEKVNQAEPATVPQKPLSPIS